MRQPNKQTLWYYITGWHIRMRCFRALSLPLKKAATLYGKTGLSCAKSNHRSRAGFMQGLSETQRGAARGCCF